MEQTELQTIEHTAFMTFPAVAIQVLFLLGMILNLFL
jgi:hypothetical protein